MSLPKKCDSGNRISPGSEKSRHSSLKVGRAPIAKSSEITPDGPQAARLSFLEDFTLEHSLHWRRITTIEIASIF